MGSGYSKMRKQARAMESQFDKMKETLKNTEITGVSGNGLVTVTITGDKELKAIKIKPECVDPSDLEGLEDLIRAACQDAYSKASEASPDLPFNLS